MTCDKKTFVFVSNVSCQKFFQLLWHELDCKMWIGACCQRTSSTTTSAVSKMSKYSPDSLISTFSSPGVETSRTDCVRQFTLAKCRMKSIPQRKVNWKKLWLASVSVCDVLINFPTRSVIAKGRGDSLMQLNWRIINNTYSNEIHLDARSASQTPAQFLLAKKKKSL